MELMRWQAVLFLSLVGSATIGADGLTQELKVQTAEGLGVELSENGALKTLSLDGENLLPDDLPDFFPLSICDVAKGTEFLSAKGNAVAGEGGGIIQRANMEDMSLHATARYESTNELIRIRLTVRDTSGADRGLYVRFAIPIEAEGWQWWDDLETSRKIGATGTYENSKGIREFGALPEWADKPVLKMGYHSVNFCNVITGPVGLCYAVPLDQPRIFRTGYDADDEVFYIVYDVALAKETDPPSAADFTFFLYRSDPGWGMRSALDRYYRIFPQFFSKYVKREGMWMAFSKLSDIDNVNEFRFAFQEGAPEPGYDDKLGVYSLTYFTHAGMFARIPDYDPEKDPEPSYDRQLAAMRENFKRSTGSAQIFDTSGLYDAEGRLSIKRTAVYGHIIAQYNLDPALPYGKHMLEKIPSVFEYYHEKRGGELDGFYYDGITTGINYRRDHFKYANYPPIWDPVNKKPFLYNYFSSVEFAEEAANRLHEMGKITMMNGAMGSSFYTAPYLDVMGSETGLRIKRTSFNYVRAICRQKPFVTLLKGNFSELTDKDIALFMKRCVAYGVFPGFFDWPPSGLGPGSRYWDHAEWYERDRLNHRRYHALAQQLASAGWEPMTLARSSNSEITLERFGNPEKGELFFTVLNDSAFPAKTVVSVPATELADDCIVVDEVLLGRLDARREDDQLHVPLNLDPESLVVLHIAPKRNLAISQADEIVKNLELRKQMAEIDSDRPEYLVHWRPTRYGGYERDDLDVRSCLKLSNDSETEIKGAMQWVMLYQDQPDPLKLRLKLKCDNAKPGKGEGFLVDAVLCHVNMQTRFTERKREKYSLDVGSYDWREKEILIKPERPLRSIQLSVYLWKCSGSAWIDEISVTPAGKPDQEYVVDPKMEQWYERLDAEESKELDSKFAELEDEINQFKASKGEELVNKCVSILNKTRATEKWIVEKKLENPCRRALRELADTSERLCLVCSMLMGIAGPHVIAPECAVPGEEIHVNVRVDGIAKDKVRYTIQVPDGWRARAAGEGKFAVTVPMGGIGTTARIGATAAVESVHGLKLSLDGSAQVRIVPVIEASMCLDDVSASGDRFHFSVDVANNDRTPTEVSIKTRLPTGWRVETTAERCEVAAKSREAVKFCAIAAKDTRPGRYEIHAELSSPKLVPSPRRFAETVFFLPASLNLLKDPGFEKEGLPDWAKNERGYEIDASQSHSGSQSLRLRNDSTAQRSGASQTIVLNQKQACPIIVRGHARVEKVSGHPDRTFSLYIDIYYTDGTPLYGQTINWETGTTGWQYGETIIEPAKPIRNVNVYCLLRRHSGTAWFDDIFVAEDPTRRNNVARQAKVSVDSCYRSYTPAVINDGVTRIEDIHWTEESWASAETDGPHWIELEFDKPITIKKMLIYWSMDKGVPRTSKKIEVQAWREGGWQTVCDKTMDKAEPITVLEVAGGFAAQKLRLFQPPGCGPTDRPNLMWVREIEMYDR